MKILLRWNYKMKRTDKRLRIEDRGQTKDEINNVELRLGGKSVDSLVCLLSSVFCLISFIGCATPSAHVPAPPAKYVYNMEKPEVEMTANSLWSDSVNIFEDRKARGLNDLVTIDIFESLSGSGTADTETTRDSSLDYELTKLLAMDLDFNLQNKSLLKSFYKTGKFEPSIAGTGSSSFKGEGDTNREGELIATITAKVVEVLPNRNMILEARKEITINEETQILVLTGMVRPDDIDSDNIVLSNKIADARIYYVGDGVIQDKQKPGWLVRWVDHLWLY
jgi:flagellar L-ring protein precursor FlgH